MNYREENDRNMNLMIDEMSTPEQPDEYFDIVGMPDYWDALEAVESLTVDVVDLSAMVDDSDAFLISVVETGNRVVAAYKALMAATRHNGADQSIRDWEEIVAEMEVRYG